MARSDEESILLFKIVFGGRAGSLSALISIKIRAGGSPASTAPASPRCSPFSLALICPHPHCPCLLNLRTWPFSFFPHLFSHPRTKPFTSPIYLFIPPRGFDAASPPYL